MSTKSAMIAALLITPPLITLMLACAKQATPLPPVTMERRSINRVDWSAFEGKTIRRIDNSHYARLLIYFTDGTHVHLSGYKGIEVSLDYP